MTPQGNKSYFLLSSVTRCKRMRGLSLVELMVALLISSLILIGLIQIFINSRTTYHIDEGLARLQENGRFAMDFLARDIRMAGNMGCIGRIPSNKLQEMTTNYLNSTVSPFDLSRGGIEGFEATGTGPGAAFSLPTIYPATNVSATTPSLDTNLLAGAVKGSDVLVLRETDPDSVSLAAPYNDSAQIFVTQPNNLQSDQILIVTDCSRVSIFQATAVSNGASGTTNVAHAKAGTPGNICPNWGQGGCPGKTYKQGAQISQFVTMVYYVGKGVYGGPSLFKRTWGTGAAADTELVEGVENMQFLYGVDTDNDTKHSADMYVTADKIPNGAGGTPDWSKVVSVRIGLLVSGRPSSNTAGMSDTAMNTAKYNVAGATIDPVDDLRQRRVFTSTIELRNR